MDDLVRFKLKPHRVWTTEWRADTLLGALANAWARREGPEYLNFFLLEPWLAGEPPFVISDAFPEGTLPAPALLPLRDWPAEERKKVKKLRWLSSDQFRAVQCGGKVVLDAVPSIDIKTGIQMRNTIDRTAGTAGGAGGNLFQTAYSRLGDPDAALHLYARTNADGQAILTEALQMLGQTGFGANASIGYGGFDLEGDPEPCPELDEVSNADGFISLSTFQPAPSDPAAGYWRMFVKYGKLAPEFQHIHPQAAFKQPQIMLEPGACFRTGDKPRPFYGNAIEPERLFPREVRQALAERDIAPVQPAFALALPMAWRKENEL